jgi:hypothetical protein
MTKKHHEDGENKSKGSKLNPEVVGREPVPSNPFELEYVHIEWKHDDGPVKDHILQAVNSGTPQETYEKAEVGERDAIKDHVIVPTGTPDDECLAQVLPKRKRLMQQLGLAE